jgi:hypothetical protein
LHNSNINNEESILETDNKKKQLNYEGSEFNSEEKDIDDEISVFWTNMGIVNNA